MLSHVWAWLRRVLEGKCNSSHCFSSLSLCPLANMLNKTLTVHLREAVETFNVEAINTVLSHGN